MINLWNLIVETNTLNFIVLVLILFFVCKKINLAQMISNLQKNIENNVTDSNLAKTNSEKALKTAEEKMENVENEIETIIEDTKNTAKIVSKNILLHANEQIKTIENNTNKIIENEINKTKKLLSDMTVKTSVTLLKKNLKNNLTKDKNLHQVFIDEAITELEGLYI